VHKTIHKLGVIKSALF